MNFRRVRSKIGPVLCFVFLAGRVQAFTDFWLTSGSVDYTEGSQEARFTLVLNRQPEFFTLDAAGRVATEFQFYIGDTRDIPATDGPWASIIRGREIHINNDLRIRDQGPWDPTDADSGVWGPVRGSVSFKLEGKKLTFSVPLSVLNVSGRFGYRLLLRTYADGLLTDSRGNIEYRGIAGEQMGGGPIKLVEAESARLSSGMELVRDLRAYNEHWIVSSSPEGGSAILPFFADVAAEYSIYARVIARDPSHDSSFVRIDGSDEQIYDVAFNKWGPNWQWDTVTARQAGNPGNQPSPPRTFRLEAGYHTLEFRTREPSVPLDAIFVAPAGWPHPATFLPENLELPQKQRVKPGEIVTLTSVTTAAGPLNYSWGSNEPGPPASTSRSLTAENVDACDLGEYALSITVADLTFYIPGFSFHVIGPVQARIDAAAAGDTIVLEAGTFSEHLVIEKNLTLRGAGPKATILSGCGRGRVIEVGKGASVHIEGLRITEGGKSWENGRGFSNAGGKVVCKNVEIVEASEASGYSGAPILNDGGTLALIDCIIAEHDEAVSPAIWNQFGGSITLDRCVVDYNGAAVLRNYELSAAVFLGCTITSSLPLGSSCVSNLNPTPGSVLLDSCIVALTDLSPPPYVSYFSGEVSLRNSIIPPKSQHTLGSPLHVDGRIKSLGFNLITEPNRFEIVGETQSNIYGVDPMLGPPRDNGGPTLTRALLPGSPAIDRGHSGGAKVDQRGFPRIVDLPGIFNSGDGADIGPFELGAGSAPFSLTLEAEAGRLSGNIVIVQDALAFGGGAIEVEPPVGGTAILEFMIPSDGVYAVWCRTLAPDLNSDSFFVSLDGADEFIYDVAFGRWGILWQWDQLTARPQGGTGQSASPIRLLDLTAGRHTIQFRAREAGVGIDEILLTSDLALLPSLAPPPTLPPSPTLKLTILEPNATISWDGKAGFEYEVQEAQAIGGPWITVRTVTSSPFAHSTASTLEQRYYRVISRAR